MGCRCGCLHWFYISGPTGEPRIISGHSDKSQINYTCFARTSEHMPIRLLQCFLSSFPETTAILLRWYHYNDVIMSTMWVSNHQPPPLFIQPFIQAHIKNPSKLYVTGLCDGNSPVNAEFPAQRASNTENVSIWRRHHVLVLMTCLELFLSPSHKKYWKAIFGNDAMSFPTK